MPMGGPLSTTRARSTRTESRAVAGQITALLSFLPAAIAVHLEHGLCLHCAPLLNKQTVHKSIEDQTSCLPSPEYTAVTSHIIHGVPRSITGSLLLSLLLSLSPIPLARLSAGIPPVSHAQIICTGLRGNTETSGRFFPWRRASCQSIQRSLLSLPPRKDPLDASSIPTRRCRDPPASDKGSPLSSVLICQLCQELLQ